jgi:hypothetical protein
VLISVRVRVAIGGLILILIAFARGVAVITAEVFFGLATLKQLRVLAALYAVGDSIAESDPCWSRRCGLNAAGGVLNFFVPGFVARNESAAIRICAPATAGYVGSFANFGVTLSLVLPFTKSSVDAQTLLIDSFLLNLFGVHECAAAPVKITATSNWGDDFTISPCCALGDSDEVAII